VVYGGRLRSVVLSCIASADVEVKMHGGSYVCGPHYSTIHFSIIIVAIATAGTWHYEAVELVQELGRRATIITGDPRETTYPVCCSSYQWLCKRGTRSRFGTRSQPDSLPHTSYSYFCVTSVFSANGFVLAGRKNNLPDEEGGHMSPRRGSNVPTSNGAVS